MINLLFNFFIFASQLWTIFLTVFDDDLEENKRADELFEARRVTSKVPRFDLDVFKSIMELDHAIRFGHNNTNIDWEPYTPKWNETEPEEQEQIYEEQEYVDKEYVTIETSNEFKNWMYSTESTLGPWLETLIFVTDLWPMICMCNIVSATSYSQYDEVSTELECINKAFEKFHVVWQKEPVKKILDFSEFGY
jgi:hypothetical protein